MRESDRIDELALVVFGWFRALLRWSPWIIAAALLYSALQWREAVDLHLEQHGREIERLSSEAHGDVQGKTFVDRLREEYPGQ